MNIPLLTRYTRWLHTGYPNGKPEKLPEVNEDGSTAVPGVYVIGDLQGIPLLKFSTDSGARAIETITNSAQFKKARESKPEGALDLVIIGAGVAGISAALRAKKKGLDFQILESGKAFSTIVNFPKAKPIYTYPKEFEPDTDLETTGATREALLDELWQQLRSANLEVKEEAPVESVRRKSGVLEVRTKDGDVIKACSVIIAIGRSGNYRTLNVPGEDLNKVSNRLHDPKDYQNQKILVVGGGDSALETAIALAENGAEVTLSYRGTEFSRPKPENAERLADLKVEKPSPGKIALHLNSEVTEIQQDKVHLNLKGSKEQLVIPNDYVFTMLGREAPLDFLRKSGIPIAGDWGLLKVASFAAFLIFCFWLYLWKAGSGPVANYFYENSLFPFNLDSVYASLTGTLGEAVNNPGHILGTIAISIKSPGFYYTLAYSTIVAIFGWRRIRRRRTPYIKVQTITLAIIQILPLFLLPEIILPWMGHNEWFDDGILHTIANGLFPEVGYGHGREYWRAYGLILAWPLFIYNIFTAEPMFWWLAIGFLQTFVAIPAMIFFWGKGAYCGWICSCGALAETLGDTHRHKMPHGRFWSRLNMTGQVILWIALILLGIRIYGWVVKASAADEDGNIPEEKYEELPWLATSFDYLIEGKEGGWQIISETGESIPEDRIEWVQESPGDDGWLAYVLNESGERIIEEDGTALTARDKYVEEINYFTYKWIVDVLLAGIIGVGFYFWFSGRVWCRFACPLAALMHIYTKFSRFRIIPDKKKCISCNVCTSVCHQGIDVMNFANKGMPMEDPECVRCSSCVWSCPTGVLQFGQVNSNNQPIHYDKLMASPVIMREGRDVEPASKPPADHPGLVEIHHSKIQEDGGANSN